MPSLVPAACNIKAQLITLCYYWLYVSFLHNTWLTIRVQAAKWTKTVWAFTIDHYWTVKLCKV